MGKKTLSQQAQNFNELTFNELCNVCRNIVEGAKVTEDKGVPTFAELLNKFRQLRHTQKRATYTPNLIDKKERQEREIDDIIQRYFSSQLTLFKRK
jgi:hypothetical protein